MAVVYLGARDGLIDGAPLQHLRRRKFRAVVKGDAFEDCPEPSGTAFPLQRIQRLDHGFRLSVRYSYDDVFPRLALIQGQQGAGGLAFALSAVHGVALPMPELLAALHLRRALFNAVACGGSGLIVLGLDLFIALLVLPVARQVHLRDL